MTNAETKTPPPRPEKASSTVDEQPEIHALTSNLTRLAQAHAVSVTEFLSGTINVLGKLHGDLISAAAKPLESITERRKRDSEGRVEGRADSRVLPEGIVNITESLDRSVRDFADVVDRTASRFSGEYRAKKDGN